MAYNKLHKYRRIVALQDFVLQIQDQYPDMGSGKIYNDYVYPRFHLSKSTYYAYLRINAKNLLREVEDPGQSTDNQLKLFDI